MSNCKVCGKKLELTPEYDMCMECQGKQHRTFTIPNNKGSVSNKTEMNIYDEAIEYLKNGSDDLYSYQVLGIIKALERAKKVEELLGLYRNLSMETDVFERSKYWERINKIELEELK